MSRALPTRRQLLTGGLAAITAGSAGCLSILTNNQTSDGKTRKLRLSLDRWDGPLRESKVVDGENPPERWTDGALAAAIGGEAFTSQNRKPFFSRPNDPEYVRYNGTYYELGSVIINEATETHPVLRLYTVEDGEGTPDGIATESLPDVDRHAVEIAHMAARSRGDEGGMPVGLVERGGYVYRNGQTTADSQLLAEDGPDHVTFRDTLYAVEITRETFHEPVYRATATPVAETPERMESILRARFVDVRLAPDDLSQDTREIIREASSPESYSETHPYSDAFDELLTAMHKHPFLDGNIEKDARPSDVGAGMLLYDEDYYEYRLHLTTEA